MSVIKDEYFIEVIQSLQQLIDMPMCICDKDFNIIPEIQLAVPTTFCGTMQQKYPEFFNQCKKCDMASFEKCKNTKTFNLYRCHAGLVEATAPIIVDGEIEGYVMFGQKTDNPNLENFIKTTIEHCKNYAPEDEIRELAKTVKYMSPTELMAAAKILEVCSNYIQIKDLVRPSDRQIIERINKFVDSHLSEEISVDRLCHEAGISRTKLYSIANKHLNGGLAAFVKEKRLIASKNLLKITDLPVANIAERVGFADYNYFSRAFKRRFDISPHTFRKDSKK